MSETRYFGYVSVHYALRSGELVLRTDADWEADLQPCAVGDDGQRFDFLIEHDRPYLHVKPLIHRDGGLFWAAGTNKLVVLSEQPHPLYPHFFTGDRGQITEVREVSSQVLGRALKLRLYLPPGYDENELKRYPVLYMHDGKNLFFPQEAFLGQEWRIDENLDLLDTMNLIDRTIVVGVHAEDRMREYTRDGYDAYGEALVEELKPWVDRTWRTLPDPEETAVMGSSLGGVVSLHLAWRYPGVFANAACLSSTFGYNDDLLERVRGEGRCGREDLRIYLDSGWPNDNYEATVTMAHALVEQGFPYGSHLLHLVFPHAQHNEASWSSRVHLPLQLFSGKSRRTQVRHKKPRATSRLMAKCPFEA